MFERFTKPAREVVERTRQIAIESRASQDRPEHLFAALLWDDQCLAVRVLELPGGTRERLRDELDQRGLAYVDGLDDEDAAALASIGIDLEEVVRRMGTATLRQASSPAHRGSRVRRRRCSSWRCARRLRSSTTTSAPSTSCSGWCARATRSCATPWSRRASTPRRCGPRSPKPYEGRLSEPASLPAVTKSISSSTRPSSAGSRSWKPRTPPRMCFQARAMSAWSRCGQPHCWQTPCFHSMSRGTLGHAFLPSRSGLHGRPDVDERVADDQHVLADR